jgi:hypothetical protein
VTQANTNCIHGPIWRIKYGPDAPFSTRIQFARIASKEARGENMLVCVGLFAHNTSGSRFLDDNQDNVKGVAQLRLQTILVTFLDQLTAELRARSY